MTLSARAPVRRRIRVRGAVQGVGFRPYVYRLAQELELAGWVRNDAEGVEIDLQGEARAVESLLTRLEREAPPLARIRAVEAVDAEADARAQAFAIRASRAGAVRTTVTPDVAVCAACLEELFDPRDRRYRYAFINCTHCGPRYTITRALPYDRPQTSMAAFRQCPACLAEYENPADRRFHAQPNACPVCGPRLSLTNPVGVSIGQDPIAETLARLRAGEIVAIKGLGGYHLACDARNAAAVARLRARKQREEKPFAVMVANCASLDGLASVSAQEKILLESPERPVVLLESTAELAGVAPGVASLGAMLPYTPLQYLLFHEAADRPAGTAWLTGPQPLALVMTSANPCGEPIVRGDAEAYERLAGIADAFLTHDREIVARCDDSVLRAGSFVRRARGYTPQAIELPAEGPSVLALGGYLKNTVCVTRGREAFLSPHVGDLDNAATCRALEETVERMCELLAVEPEVVAHDLHPDFYSTRLAETFGLPTIGVQHHHAHIAAVCAEHGVTEPVLGLALDGVGLGTDGKMWGGELLRVEGARWQRLGHLAPLAAPGGERAAREPWRMAAAALHALGRGAEIAARFPARNGSGIRAMLERGTACPPTTSAGRWFDAAAGLLGVREVASFEGQAAMLLEGLASRYGDALPLEQDFRIREEVLDLLPLIAALADARDTGWAAAVFHATLAEALAQWAKAAADREGIATVALGGGCFQNRILSSSLTRRMCELGLKPLHARGVPSSDGGLALGQAWVAMQARES
ncbi:MAG TPA: carbamoyltransferase HypF [Burkholderiales bacterium]|nr:carbamoyltransferase HypF [Burkholderiales bacterium]